MPPRRTGLARLLERPSRRTLLVGAAVAGVGAGLAARLATLPGPIRWSRSRQPRKVARIVVAYPPMSSHFLNGVRMAAKAVNDAGGLKGLPIVLDTVPETETYGEFDEATVRSALELASKIVAKEDVVAVLGHGTSATAVPASSVYNRAQTLYLATHATGVSLTVHDFPFVFAMQPSNAESTLALGTFVISQGLRRLVVLHDGSANAQEVARLFRTQATLRGGDVVFTGLLNSRVRSIDRLLLFLKSNSSFQASDIDAFFISALSLDDTACFITRARQLGIRVPMIGTEYLFSDQLAARVGADAMKDVFAFSTYDPASASPAAVTFAAQFQQATGEPPDLLAATGFDAVNLLAFVAGRVPTLSSRDMADALRVMRYEVPFVGATETIVFDANGLITDTNVVIVRHDGTGFRTVTRYQIPFAKDNNSLGGKTVLPSTAESTK